MGRKRGFRERGREGEKHPCEREKSIGCVLHAPWLGSKPATQACALTQNRTHELSVCGMTLNPLNHTGHSRFYSLTKKYLKSGSKFLLFTWFQFGYLYSCSKERHSSESRIRWNWMLPGIGRAAIAKRVPVYSAQSWSTYIDIRTSISAQFRRWQPND